jgi:pimeloyl-ACP methyl ester carboxylesterase
VTARESHDENEMEVPVKKLNRDSIALAYEEVGTGEPPLLFVHCWCGNHTFFARQVEHFARSHRVVAVDLRGHGASDKPYQEYTLDGFVDDLVWLCDQLRLVKPVIVGHSMGGNVALELAARHSELPAAIVLVDSVVTPGPAFLEAVRPVAEALRGPGYREAVAALYASVFLPTDDPERKARIVETASSAPQHVMSSAFEHHITDYDASAAAAACTVPTLYIGAAAPFADVERFRALCPQLMVGQTVGAGHFNLLEVPEQVNAMIERFLIVSAPRFTLDRIDAK